MKLDPETLYVQLGSLVATMPDFHQINDKAALHQWVGRVSALLEASGQRADATALNVKVDMLHMLGAQQVGDSVSQIVHRALARAEMAAPAAARGAFIAAGDTFNAFAAVGKVLQRATKDLLLVDGYADVSLLTDFVVMAPETVPVRILTALREARRDVLRPAAERWAQQYGAARPLAIRMIQAASLHDRLILVDRTEAYVTGQSFNKMAERSHTSIVRADLELAAMKVAAYEELWRAAEPV